MLLGCREQILHNLTESQANRAQLVLSQSGVVADKARDVTGWSIAVPTAVAAMAIERLEAERFIPADQPASKGSSSIVPSVEERSYELERELATSLEHTLGRLPGVLEARVHIYRKSQSPFDSAPTPDGTASVLIIVRPTVEVAIDENIKRIVAGAAGLKPDAVVVVRSDASTEVRTIPQPSTTPSEMFTTLQNSALIGIALLPFIGLLLAKRKKKTTIPQIIVEKNIPEENRVTVTQQTINGEAKVF